MSEAKHTPGPWRIDDAGPFSGNVIRFEIVHGAGDDAFTVCEIEDSVIQLESTIGNHARKKAIRRDEANARLIAAAPTLLAACEPVDAAAAMKSPFWEEDWNPEAHVEITLTIAECRAIRAAIAEAKP